MLLKNGLLVFEGGARKGDLRIAGERILKVGTGLSPEAGEETVDLEGLVVLPGGVDAHTRMDLDLRHVRATDDFFTGAKGRGKFLKRGLPDLRLRAKGEQM
ncbi:MAG: hypothetical protein FWB99_10605 [Treponema sp.]|nr:hypothetical protein [Treponema sp.]